MPCGARDRTPINQGPITKDPIILRTIFSELKDLFRLSLKMLLPCAEKKMTKRNNTGPTKRWQKDGQKNGQNLSCGPMKKGPKNV